MGAQGNAQPIIIKRRKVIAESGHHGGAWKVAYADFVTAMMAFFLLMWLLNATTEKQRKGIAEYFAPTIPINRISGGGDGALGGDSVFTEQSLARTGTGATALSPSELKRARGQTGLRNGDDEAADMEDVLRSLNEQLRGMGGESMVMENALRHITTRVTDEGLLVEVFALPDAPIFLGESDSPTPLLRAIAQVIADVAAMVANPVAIGGHVPAQPIVRAENPVWDLSARQATAMRLLLEGAGLDAARIERVTGHADREPVTRDPMAVRNNRLEVVLLRK